MVERARTILADGFHFLEGPRWRDGHLWMSNIGEGANEVVTLSPEGTRRHIAHVPGRPSGLGFLPDGTPIVVSVDQLKLFRIERGDLRLHADLTGVAQGKINDMVVDPTGRAYVDSVGYDPDAETFRPGGLVLVEPDGRARLVAHDLAGPNGCAITAEGRLVLAETAGKRLTSFEILDDGALGPPTVMIDLDARPDGLCLDEDGAIWVALLWKGFARVKDGRIVERIDTAERNAIACQLGGADGRTLFLLTATGGHNDVGARVETVRVETPAAGSP